MTDRLIRLSQEKCKQQAATEAAQEETANVHCLTPPGEETSNEPDVVTKEERERSNAEPLDDIKPPDGLVTDEKPSSGINRARNGYQLRLRGIELL